MTQIELKIGAFLEAEADIRSVRQAVFHVEQGIDAALDFDGLDHTAQHVICYAAGSPIGTARIRYLSARLAKIERVAVLANFRGQGIGKQIVEFAVRYLEQQGVPAIKLHAQKQTLSFYQKLGFQPQGEEFCEAEIIHIEMKRSCP